MLSTVILFMHSIQTLALMARNFERIQNQSQAATGTLRSSWDLISHPCSCQAQNLKHRGTAFCLHLVSSFFSPLSPGTGPLFSDCDASAFPVSVSGSAESAASGAVVSCGGAGTGAGALHRDPQSARSSERVGRGRALMERGSRGMQCIHFVNYSQNTRAHTHIHTQMQAPQCC